MSNFNSAARIGDATQHTEVPAKLEVISDFAITGVVFGTIILSGGTLTPVATVGGVALGIAADLIATQFSKAQLSQKSGIIGPGSANVYIEGKKAARACKEHLFCLVDSTKNKINEGSSRVFINRAPAARVGDKTECGAVIISGSSKVYIHGVRKQCHPPGKFWDILKIGNDIRKITKAGIALKKMPNPATAIDAAWEGQKAVREYLIGK